MPKASFVSVVDDDQFFRASTTRLVTSLGYTVEDFASAADFLASPRLAETACLIADVHMPTMTGVELYRHLVDVGYAIPDNPRYWSPRRRRASPRPERWSRLLSRQADQRGVSRTVPRFGSPIW